MSAYNSIQQHHTVAQVAHAHWHSRQIHSPGMCPPDASGICRLYAARGVVDGHGLLHELMADVMEDVPGQGSAGGAAAADSWLTVSSVTSEVCRDNAIGTLRCTCLQPQAACRQQTARSSKTTLSTMLHVKNAAFCTGQALQHAALLNELQCCSASVTACRQFTAASLPLQ